MRRLRLALLMVLAVLSPRALAGDGGYHAPPPVPPPPAEPPAQPQTVPPRAVPAGWRQLDPPVGSAGNGLRPADQRRVAFGGTLGGGSSVGFDGLLRLSRTFVFDLGLGPQLHRRTLETVGTRLTAGLTWQPGHRTTRHGIVVRTGLGFDDGAGRRTDGPVEALAMGGYAWRLVPRRRGTTVELEAAPGVLYRERGPHGQPMLAAAAFARLGVHFWIR